MKNKLKECTCFNLRKAARTVTQVFDAALQPTGLRGTQFSLLAVLSQVGSLSVTALSRKMVMDRTTLTRNIRPLEKLGLVEILPGEDRRTRYLSLTKMGQKKMKNALPLWDKAQSLVIKRLTQKRWSELTTNLSATVDLIPLE